MMYHTPTRRKRQANAMPSSNVSHISVAFPSRICVGLLWPEQTHAGEERRTSQQRQSVRQAKSPMGQQCRT